MMMAMIMKTMMTRTMRMMMMKMRKGMLMLGAMLVWRRGFW